MARVLVRYLDLAANAVQERWLEAADAAAARQQVEAGGSVVLEARIASASTWAALRHTPRDGLPAREVAVLCRELRALLGAGLSVVEALEALAGAGAGTASVHAALLERLRAGKSLSTAMRELGGFPTLLIASVQSSERTSNLDAALAAYLRYDEMVGTLRRRVLSAALYPAIVVTLGIGVALFLLMVVIPRFAALYGEMAAGAGTATRALMNLSVALHEHAWLAPALAAAIALLIGLMLQGGRWRRAGTWVARQFPWLRAQLDDFEKARVYEALALLVRGGYSLHEAIDLCRGVVSTPEGMARLEAARDAIARGTAVAPAFASAALTDSVTERLLRAGDRGGDFDRVLQAIADRHARAFETFVERATRIVEPVLLLGVALLVGGMVVLLYMPIFDIAASVR